MAVIILAGGKSRRMGNCDKAFIKIDRSPLIRQQLSLLSKHFKKIIIVSNYPDKYKSLKGVKVVPDVEKNKGPLAGILSGLLASEERYNFVVACDMPFINIDLIKYMFSNSMGFDAVVPHINNRYEPLFCVYSKNCIKDIKLLLDKKIFKISRIFSRIKIRQISRKEILKFGSPDKIFINLNTPQDFLKLNG